MASQLGSGVSRDDPDAVLLVDVGGNWGHELRGFRKTHPEVPGRLILQDLPVMTEKFQGKPPEGIEVMTYDFFTPQPVQGERDGLPWQSLQSKRDTTDPPVRCPRILLPQHLPRLA